MSLHDKKFNIVEYKDHMVVVYSVCVKIQNDYQVHLINDDYWYTSIDKLARAIETDKEFYEREQEEFETSSKYLKYISCFSISEIPNLRTNHPEYFL